jgi:hypothetical protein
LRGAWPERFIDCEAHDAEKDHQQEPCPPSPGNLLRSAEHSRARYVGSQPGVMLEWQVDRHLTLTLEYGHFFAGPFLEETEPGRDIDWSAATLTYKF